MKLSVSLPEEIVKRIDEEAKATMNTRSSFIANACREYIAALEAKRMLPKLRTAIEVAAAGKELPQELQDQIDLFTALADQYTDKV